MNTEILSIVNPFDENHIEKINFFEKENETSTKTSTYLSKCKINKEAYDSRRRNTNEIETSLFIELDNVIKDICHITGEKDRKACTITFADIKTKLKNRRIITLATDYALNNLGMKDVFVSVKQDDQNMITNLEARGYESLGEESGKLIYLKEKELLKDSQIRI